MTRGPFAIRECIQPQIQDPLASMQPLMGNMDQHRELDLVVYRPHMLHDPTDPTTLDHDLHRSRTRSRLHLANEPPTPTKAAD